MTLYSQNVDSALVYALITKVNQLQDALESTVTDSYHRSRTSVSTTQSFETPTSVSLSVTAANATNLATSLTLGANIRGVMAYHFADADAHLKADIVNVDFTTDGYGLQAGTVGAVVAFANCAKVDFNRHLSQSGVHRKTDTNVIATADATDQTSADTLLNAIKAALNTHMAGAPPVGRISINIPDSTA